MIVFKPSVGQAIGMGHLSRCLSIAKAARKSGQEVFCECSHPKACEILRNNGFVAKDLFGQADVFFLDSYTATYKEMAALSLHSKVFYMDDLNRFVYPVHTMINYNIYGEDFYTGTEQTAEMLLGPQYAPLAESFSDLAPFCVRDEIKRVFILSGGADEHNYIEKIIRRMLCQPEWKEKVFVAVLGALNSNAISLKKLAQENPGKIELYDESVKMASLMQGCDIAISAGGSTLYELSACGLPTVSFSFVDNQLANVEAFEKRGIIPTIGDFRTGVASCMQKAEITLQEKFTKKMRQNQSEKMQCLVDGKGAQRIVDRIIKVMNQV